MAKKRGRELSLTSDLQTQIIYLLRIGTTISDMCEDVGIGTSTFYQWVDVGTAYRNGFDHPKMPYYIADRDRLADFADAVSRARVQARVKAVAVLRQSLETNRTTSQTTENIQETRLREIRRHDGTIEQIPYQYNRTVVKDTVTDNPIDWRLAIELLKRRDPENWSEHHNVNIRDWRTQLLEDVQFGKIAIEQVIRQFGGLDDFRMAIGDHNIATRLLNAGNISIQGAESED